MGRKRKTTGPSSSHPAEESRNTESSAADFDKRLSSKQDRKYARRILKKDKKEPIRSDMVSRKEFIKYQEKVAWARAVLPDFDKASEPGECPELGPPLEFIKQETPHCGSSIKEEREVSHRSRSASPTLIEDENDNRKLIAVIDKSDPLGTIPLKAWKVVQSAFARVSLEVLEECPGPPPKCRDCGWFQGAVKVFTCDNQRSAALLRKAVSKLGELYPGARLDVWEAEDIPTRPRATALIPSEPSSPAEILKLIRLFNPDLPTQNWRVVGFAIGKCLRSKVTILLNQECVQPLKECGGLIEYGFNQIQLNIIETDRVGLDNFAACFDPLCEKDEEPIPIDTNILSFLAIKQETYD
ncbi:uncharacterized protein LOC108091391 [Drosophila ficusphila]|uniref:uncharacterized protein LOC108091391 n=1 Tax=Drosophila ficusphila TaxID=30025 RepID=UPI0007E831F9|nr:uncharacterized protein LOC108091391 [Drosophila ficusphila]XP_017046064.1 uncharacterized protein LOC108091391 [Drosophila ficusphila]